MSSGAEWADVGVHLVLGLASLALSVWMMTAMMGFMRGMMEHILPNNPVLNRYARGTKRKLSSLWCNHRAPYAKVRDPWGKHYTACSKCGKDLNQGKPQEEWV